MELVVTLVKNSWKAWFAVVIWIGVLITESSDLGSSQRTGALLLKLWTSLFGAPDPTMFYEVHHLLRKTGHFLGYGILSWLVFRALRATWRNRQEILSRGRDYFWQFRWAALAMLTTIVAASADEIHQSFNPARTGRWQDVVIDSSGALAIQLILFLALAIGGNKSEPQTSES
jgi:VanZ family protein